MWYILLLCVRVVFVLVKKFVLFFCVIVIELYSVNVIVDNVNLVWLCIFVIFINF